MKIISKAAPDNFESTLKGKRRIKQNIYGNWVCYIGRTRVVDTADIIDAYCWLLQTDEIDTVKAAIRADGYRL